MKKLLAGLLLATLSAMAWALPSEQQVQEAIKQGQYTQAQSMMAEVVAAKPGSAKAHYIYAELLAHNGAFNKAAEETAKAKEIDPALGFTDPAKFRSFEQTLQRENQPATRVAPRASSTAYNVAPVAPAASGGGIPGWVWLVGLVVLAVVLWRGFSRSRAAGGAPGASGAPAAAAGYGPGGMNQGYGPAGYGPGGMPGVQPRSGLLGTGLAVAGGVAGGMLLDEMLHRRDGNAGGGGLISDARADDGAARELENRPIDFGNGNDWDSGGGGGIDLGGGGGDSGGGGWD